MDANTFLTPLQIANRLQVKVDTVKGWLRDGRMKGIKVSHLWRVTEEEFNRFLGPTSDMSK
jgi:excisionase family DNA binding protein